MHLTEHMILARSKQSDLNTVKRINLWGCELTDISIMSHLINVEVLALSVNSLSCLKPLETCTKLQELYLRKNNIEDFDQLLHLQNLPFLTHLCLAENPCCLKAGAAYRANVVKMLPNLKKLDEEFITIEDIELAKELDCLPNESGGITENVCDIEKVSGETIEQALPLQHSNESIHSNIHEQMDNENLMLQESNLDFNTSIEKSNLIMDKLPSHFEKPKSLNKSFPLENSIASTQIVENSQSIFPSSIEDQALQKEYSLFESISQWNFAVQINQPQSGQKTPQEIPRSKSIQSFTECLTHDDEQWNLKFNNGSCEEHKKILGMEKVPKITLPRYLSKTNRYLSRKNDLHTKGIRTHSATTLNRSPNTTRYNANLLSGALCVVQSLDIKSLQVLNHTIQRRMNELSLK